MRRWGLISAVLLTMAIPAGAQEGRRGRGPQGPPNITGAWSGTWSAYNPARASTPPKEQCAKLAANITQKGDVWEAVFEGDCGRPYRYTIKMEGKQSGNVVMFKGTRISAQGRRRVRLDRPGRGRGVRRLLHERGVYGRVQFESGQVGGRRGGSEACGQPAPATRRISPFAMCPSVSTTNSFSRARTRAFRSSRESPRNTGTLH